MNWSLIGLGFISPRHIQGIRESGGNLLATFDVNVAKSSVSPRGTKFYSNHEEFMDSEELKKSDWVAICTPNDTHWRLCKELLLKDKNVLCEKPLTLTTSSAISLEYLAQNGRKLYTVLQLRHHPLVKKLKTMSRPNEVSIAARVVRDNSYWNSWKGDESLSGGTLVNLGIHYLDLLIYLLGNEYSVSEKESGRNFARGKILFDDVLASYDFEILDSREGQDRYIEVDGKRYGLSNKDNLSFEGLHTDVYNSLVVGKGIPVSEAMKSLKLAEQLQ